MSRCLCVHPKYIQSVNLIWKRKSNGREQAVAEDLGLSLPMIHLFLEGKSINGLNFLEICQTLGLNWRKVAGLEPANSPVSPSPTDTHPGDAIAKSSTDKVVSDLDRAIDDVVRVLCEMLRRLTRKAGDLLRADRTSIFLLDRKRNKLGSINAEDGEGGSLVIEIPLGRGIASLAITSSCVINMPFDVYDDPRSEEAKKTDKRTGYRTYTILAWPLFNERQDLVAVVQLINKLKPKYHPKADLSRKIDTNGFTPEDEVLFASYTSSILQILERCQFCYQLTQKLREDTALKKPSVLLQNAKLIAGLKQQEKQMRKFLERM